MCILFKYTKDLHVVEVFGNFSVVPEVRSDDGVGLHESLVGSTGEVTDSTGSTGGLSVDILDTSEFEETLDSGSGNDTGTTGSGDKTDHDGTSLRGNGTVEGVRLTDVGTPVTTTNGDDVELGSVDSTTDSESDFLGGLDTETDVTVFITNDNEGLEGGTLTGGALLLDGLDDKNVFTHLVFRDEVVNDLSFLDGERVEEDLFEGRNLTILDHTAELGGRNPFVLGRRLLVTLRHFSKLQIFFRVF